MSDNLTAAAAALSAPETIVQRSAEARAKATGASVDDILAAWAGGGAAPTPAAAPAAAASAAPSEPAAERAAEPAPAATAVAVAEPPPPAQPAPEPAPAAVAPPPPVVVDEKPPEAAPLTARRRVAGRIGFLAGAATGLVTPLAFAPLLITRASLTGEEAPFSPAVELGPLTIGSGEEPFQIDGSALAVLGLLLLFAVAGIAIAHLTRTITAWHGQGMALRGGIGTTSAIGAALGAVLGIATGALVSGPFAAPLEGAEGFTLIPLLTGAVLVILGGAVMGWLTGQMVQVVGVPEGQVAEDPEEAETVRRRLGNAFALPIVGVVGILLAVLPSAYVFLAFPSFAPVMAMIISGAILAFAGLAASRPGTKVTRGEFIAAAAAIGVVVIIILAVLNAVGAGHGDEEEGEAEPEPEAVLVIS